MSIMSTAATRELATFLAGLRFEDLPGRVVERTKELFLDWTASALAGKNAQPVRIFERFAETMGPAGGPSEVLVSRRRTSPLFAALVNGAASHVVEQDDLHNASVFHPATIVFPAALASAQQTGASGRDLIAASVVGYETGSSENLMKRSQRLPARRPWSFSPLRRERACAADRTCRARTSNASLA
jgi:2-methylcitrate dehydratase PrpD